MNHERHPHQGLDLRSIEGDQRVVLDLLRRRDRVVRSGQHGWMVLGHAEAIEVLEDHGTFSNRVSRHLSIPNGMDPPEHTAYRELIEPFFAPDAMTGFETHCQQVIEELVASLPRGIDIEAMSMLGKELAARVQTTFMGWPEHLRKPLHGWAHANHAATRSGERTERARVAEEFAREIRDILKSRRAPAAGHPEDPTTVLLNARVDGRPLSDEEITSIVRNWTMGEVGTIAASVGIITSYLATNPEVQDRLRTRPDQLSAAIDEILRIDGPLTMNRRVATRTVRLGGHTIAAEDRLTIVWTSVNRDESVFGDPDRYSPGQHAGDNLLYGAGIHLCPGAPLARMQLTTLAAELLSRTDRIELGSTPPERADFPAGGYASVWVRLH